VLFRSYSVADRLTNEIPGAYRPNQYYNAANPAEHERSTGPEIWHQTAGKITHFVAGVGTGGTITGVARYLKAQSPDAQVIGRPDERWGGEARAGRWGGEAEGVGGGPGAVWRTVVSRDEPDDGYEIRFSWAVS